VNRVRGLGKPLRIREILTGIFLFELGFGIALALYFLFESNADKLADQDLEVAGWSLFALWVIFAASVVLAGLGFIVAEGVMRPRTWRQRVVVAVLAGALFGIGWLVPFAISWEISRLVTDLDTLGVLLFWSYLVAGPVLSFVVVARVSALAAQWQQSAAS
jgi:hypothetical protein